MTPTHLNDAQKQLAADTARKAEPVFKVAGWTYGDDTEPPDAERLQQTIESLLEAIVRNQNNPDPVVSARTGRFCAFREVDSGDVIWGVDLQLGDFYESDLR